MLGLFKAITARSSLNTIGFYILKCSPTSPTDHVKKRDDLITLSKILQDDFVTVEGFTKIILY